uniref:Non-structural protein 3 n=1 Tax=Human coronavirus NL63 TaxID=277944 RepID=H9EJA1_CVHNL|nr:non-structural protein 3 [Human coronavirus NL63]
MPFGGLFQLTLESTINKSVANLKLPPHDVTVLRDNLKPVTTLSTITAYLLVSLFVTYFALFKPLTARGRVACFVLKLLTIFVYVPLLVLFGMYLDSFIIFSTLLFRFIHVGYYAYLYKNFSFVLFNVTKLCFISGKCWYLEQSFYENRFAAIYGGDHYVVLGGETITFVSFDDLYVAIRGSCEKNLQLMRKVDLYNGAVIYIFAEEPVVGIVYSSQLYEDVPSIN